MSVRSSRFSVLLTLTCAGALMSMGFSGGSAVAQAQDPGPAPVPVPPAQAPAPDPDLDQDQPPAIASLTPASGPAGTPVAIHGTHLNGASEADFGDAKAAISVTSPTEAQTTVPADAEVGPVEVTVITPSGASAPATFTVTAK